MRAVELFAGAGGASLGLRAAGFESVASIELDEDACATLTAAGFPARQVDARSFADDVGPVDLLWASPPCQAFSTAGSRLGAADTERNLWPATLDQVDRIKPTWVICENVVGLTQHSAKHCGDPLPLLLPERQGDPATRCPGCYWRDVIVPAFRARFASVQVRILNAADYGVPQRRRRVFLIAGPKPPVWPAPTHTGDPESMFGKPWVTLRQALRLDLVDDEARRGCKRGEVCRTIGTRGNTMVIGGGRNPSRPGDKRRYRDLTDEPSTTVAAVRIGNAGPFVVRNGSRRRLTEAECAILQGFPPDHPFQYRTKASHYRQIGNAVPPKVAELLGRCVMETA